MTAVRVSPLCNPLLELTPCRVGDNDDRLLFKSMSMVISPVGVLETLTG